MQFPGDDVRLHLGHLSLQLGGDSGIEGRKPDHAVLEATPQIGAGPGARQNFVDDLGVEIAPDVGGARELRRGAVFRHIGVVRECVEVLVLLVLFFGGLHHGGGIRVVGNHVRALGNQRKGGFAFLAGIKPGIDPDDPHLGLGVDAAHALGEGVDALHHFGNGEGRHIPRDVGLGHLAGDDAVQIAALIEPRIVGAEVLALLVARGMEEGDVGEGRRHLGGLVHVAEGCGEHDPGAILGQLANDALGIGTFGHIFDELGGHLALERRLHLFAALVVLEGPARIPHGADVDKTNLGGRICRQKRRGREQGRTAQDGQDEIPVVHAGFLQVKGKKTIKNGCIDGSSGIRQEGLTKGSRRIQSNGTAVSGDEHQHQHRGGIGQGG